MIDELDSIFNEEAQRVSEKEVVVEQSQRELMSYSCWIIHGTKESSRLLRMLDVCHCEHSDAVKNDELLERIDYGLRTDDMRFIGIDITYRTFRSLVHFYKNITSVFDKTYAINNNGRFIIKHNGMIVHCGRLMTDFLRLTLDKKMFEVDERLDEMKESIYNSLSNRIFEEILNIEYCNYFDVTSVVQDMYIFLKDEFATPFNVFSDNLDTIMSRGTENVTIRRQIYRCACYRLNDNTFDLAMILTDAVSGPDRFLFFRHFNNINEFLDMTVFNRTIMDTLNEHSIDVAAYYDQCFRKDKNVY